jgi:acyl carrier protein
METETKIIQTIAKVFSADPATLSASTSQHELKKWDSLGQLRLIMQLEADFNLTFTIDEIPHLTSVTKIAESIRSKKELISE